MMRLIATLILLLTFTSFISAQEDVWKPGEDGFEFNCDTLEKLQATISDSEAKVLDTANLPFVRVDGTELSVERYISLIVVFQFQNNPKISLNMDAILGTAVTACSTSSNESNAAGTENGTFNVTVSSNANLRSCAGTTCEVVGQTTSGQTLKVVAVDGDWYEVEYNDGTAFIASFLTTRAPDNLITTDEPYQDARTGCVVAFDVKRGSADMSLILAGDKRNDVLVDLYRPNESKPLKVEGQLDKNFSDTGEPYILQYYRFNIGWPVGVYGLEFTVDGETSKVAWEVKERGDYNVYLVCN